MNLRRVLCLGGALLWVACNGSSLPDSEIAAKVNGKAVTLADFNAAVERNLARYQRQGHALPPGIEGRIKESVLRKLVNEEIIRQKSKELGVTVSDEELEERFSQHKSRFQTDQAFNDYLKRSGNTVENMKGDLKRSLMRDRLVEKMSGSVAVSDADVEKYYNDNIARFEEKEKIKSQRILLRVPAKATPAERAKIEKTAKSLRAKAAKKGADFAALAKENSEGPEASRGGEMAWMPRGRMTAEFDAAVFVLAPGQVSEVVPTRLGYEIIKLIEKKEARQRPLEEVAESIRNSLNARRKNEARRDVLKRLKEGSKVETLIEFAAKQPAAANPSAQKLAPKVPQAPAAEGAATEKPATP